MIYISIVVQLSRKIIKHFYNEPVYVADGGETMAYSELIKNFNKIRDYMRDFYVYGFKAGMIIRRKVPGLMMTRNVA